MRKGAKKFQLNDPIAGNTFSVFPVLFGRIGLRIRVGYVMMRQERNYKKYDKNVLRVGGFSKMNV